MGNFVRDHLANPLLARPGSRIRIVQQQIFAKSDRAPVFHGPEGEVRDGDQIHLRQRIGDPIVVFAIRERLAAEFESISGIRRHTRGGGDPHPRIFRIHHEFELPDPEEQQVSRHFGCLLKGYPLFAVCQGFFGVDERVGYRRKTGVDDHFNRESRFFKRMIHAGKRPAGVTFLELRHGDIACLTIFPVTAAVKTGHPVVDLTLVLDNQ